MKKTEISPTQKQFWILQNLDETTTAYNLPILATVSSDLEIDVLEKAVNFLVRRHEMLRTFFGEENGSIVQSPSQSTDLRISIKISDPDTVFSSRPLSEELRNEIHTTFKLTEWPLFRVKLFKYRNAWVLSFVFHHIIFDLVTANIFFNELGEIYSAFLSGTDPVLPEPGENYSEYCLWLKEHLSSARGRQKLEEWKAAIPEKPEKLEFPSLSAVPSVREKGKRIPFSIDNQLSQEVAEFARKNFVNDFIVMLSAWAVFLNRLTNRDDIIIGVPFRNRLRGRFDRTFGCFVNILPLPVNLKGDLSGKALIKQVLNAMLRTERREEIPLLELNSFLGKGDGTGLFQAGFTFDPGVELRLGDVKVKQHEIERDGAQLDLFLSLWEKGGIYNAYLEYNGAIYNEGDAMLFWEIWTGILKSLMRNPELPVNSYQILPDNQLQLIHQFNDTVADYENSICLHEKFERQAALSPNATALLFGDDRLTYRQFDEHANRTANHLIDTGIRVEDTVCICCERSAQMMIGIYGILKAGAAYLPVSPETPAERMSAIFSNAKPGAVLTTRISESNIPGGIRKIYIDDILVHPLSQNHLKPEVMVTSRNLAYVIFTSGSTGIPKGVMVEHHSVLNRLGWMQKLFPVGASDVLLQKTPITFDVSVWELFGWSLFGAALAILPPGGEKDPETIVKNIVKHKVTLVHFVPSMFIAFLGMTRALNLLPSLAGLRRIHMSGEALPEKVVEEFYSLRSSYKLPSILNLYGPTEATVEVSWYECEPGNFKHVYIGKPVDNTGLYVVNSNLMIQPVGLPGELLITGVNLARGYMNQPDLTAERFVNFNIPGRGVVRAYRTGDLCRMTTEGGIDYIGRIDFQVKIRGFRIELGDIEAQLYKNPLVDTCAVVVSADEEPKSLIAYISPVKGSKPETEELRKFLAARLPEYMIPSFFVFLDALPHTSSGKISRKELPKPVRNTGAGEIALPGDNTQKRILAVWRDLLRLDNVSVHANFFDIGGNSLLAINLAALLSAEFRIEMKTLGVLGHPTIRGQGEYINSLTAPVAVSDNLSGAEEKTEQRKNIDFQRRRG